MLLYHATLTNLKMSGALKRPQRGLDTFSNPSHRSAEEALEAACPKPSHSRLSSWYSCEKPELAAKYLEAEGFLQPAAQSATRHLFSVEVSCYSTHPMFLVDQIAKRLAKGEKAAAVKLAQEYWVPTMDWKFWECLSPDLTVLAEEAWPSVMQLTLAGLTYQGEKKTYEALLSKLGLSP